MHVGLEQGLNGATSSRLQALIFLGSVDKY